MLNPSPRRRAGRVHLPLVLLPLLALAGCDLGGPETQSIVGTWSVEDAGGALFIHITDDTFTIYEREPGECFQRVHYVLEHREATEYLISFDGGVDQTLILLRAQDGVLVVNESFQLTSSDHDVGTLPVCAAGPLDPAITCGDLPALSPGETITGSLSTEDAEWQDRFYDLYGLTLESATTVVIGMSSTQVDAFVSLYRGTGELIAFNNNASAQTTNASLPMNLEPGCYRIEATSSEDGSTGSYTLSVN